MKVTIDEHGKGKRIDVSDNTEVCARIYLNRDGSFNGDSWIKGL